MNSSIRFPVAIAVTLAGAFLLAGCQTTSSQPKPSASASTATMYPADMETGKPVPECSTAQLQIQYTDNSQIRNAALEGTSHADQVITFTNRSATACETGGYPGVAALNSAGAQVMQAVRTPETGDAIPMLPGAVASVLVSANTASCSSFTDVAGLLVTPPDQSTSVRLGPAGHFCLNSLQVGTLKPGDAAGLTK